MGISLGAMASCCGPVAVPLQLGWGALAPDRVVRGDSQFRTGIRPMEGSRRVSPECRGRVCGTACCRCSWPASGSIEDTYKVIAAAATAYPPMRSILPSLAILGNDYAGNSYLISPMASRPSRFRRRRDPTTARNGSFHQGRPTCSASPFQGPAWAPSARSPLALRAAAPAALPSTLRARRCCWRRTRQARHSSRAGLGHAPGTGPCVVTMNSDVTVAAAIAPPPPDNACCMGYFDAYCTVYGPGGCWRDFASTYVNGVCQAPASGYPGPWIATPGPCNCDPALYVVCSP